MRTIPTPDVDFIIKAVATSWPRIPFYSSLVQAGFPSPVENYIERVCDLNDLCITNPEATYFVRVTGDSMTGDRIEPGDIIVVDSSREAVDGRIAVVWFNGKYMVKRIRHRTGGPASPLVILEPSNPNYDPIYVQPDDSFRVFGVVTFVILKTV